MFSGVAATSRSDSGASHLPWPFQLRRRAPRCVGGRCRQILSIPGSGIRPNLGTGQEPFGVRDLLGVHIAVAPIIDENLEEISRAVGISSLFEDPTHPMMTSYIVRVGKILPRSSSVISRKRSSAFSGLPDAR